MRCTELRTIIISLRNHCAQMPDTMGLVIKMALSIVIFQQFNEAYAHLNSHTSLRSIRSRSKRRTLPGATGLMKPHQRTISLNAPKRPIVIQIRRAQFGVGPARDEPIMVSKNNVPQR